MTKHELVVKLAEKCECLQKDAKRFIDELDAIIENELKENQRFDGLASGSLKVKTRAARKGTNPQTGKQIDVPEKKTVVFRPSKRFKESIN
jgi:DNA-binding protein HU-beta